MQEPWEEEGLGSFQIMIAVQQQQQRPAIPPMEQLPGQLGPAEAVAGYITLMQVGYEDDCYNSCFCVLYGVIAIPPMEQLPGKLGPAEAVAGYIALTGGAAGLLATVIRCYLYKRLHGYSSHGQLGPAEAVAGYIALIRCAGRTVITLLLVTNVVAAVTAS
jgi:hypothetical protein